MPRKHHEKEHKKERKPRKKHEKPKSLYATLAGIVGLAGATGLRAAAKSQKGQEYIAKGKQLANEYKEKMPKLKLNPRIVGKGNASKYWRFYGENKAHFDRMHGERAMEELKKAYHSVKHTLKY